MCKAAAFSTFKFSTVLKFKLNVSTEILGTSPKGSVGNKCDKQKTQKRLETWE